jgi:hypothetical protein
MLPCLLLLMRSILPRLLSDYLDFLGIYPPIAIEDLSRFLKFPVYIISTFYDGSWFLAGQLFYPLLYDVCFNHSLSCSAKFNNWVIQKDPSGHQQDPSGQQGQGGTGQGPSGH